MHAKYIAVLSLQREPFNKREIGRGRACWVGLTVAIDDALLVDGLVFRIELSKRLNVLAIAESHGLRVGLLGIGTLVGNVYCI